MIRDDNKKFLDRSSRQAESGNEDCNQMNFDILFRSEGVYKIRPQISRLTLLNNECSIGDDNIFIPTISFNVITKFA